MDQQGSTSKVHSTQLTVTNKKYRSKPGDPTEIKTQEDGATVAIKEASTDEEGYVRAVLGVNSGGYPKNTEIQVKALDYTSKSDSDNLDIILPNKKLASVKKADVKLFEAGVYNSETDIKNNPKTDENKPERLSGQLDVVIDGIENALTTLEEVKTYIETDTTFSSELLNTCLTNLKTYKKTLSQEKETSSSVTVEA